MSKILPNSKIDKKTTRLVIDYAETLGASYVEFRSMILTNQSITLKNVSVERVLDSSSDGCNVRLIFDDSWGFSATNSFRLDDLKKCVKDAIKMAKLTKPLNKDPVSISDEPTYTDSFISDYEINPLNVSLGEKIDRLKHISNLSLKDKFITFTDFDLKLVEESSVFANSAGSYITQSRVRSHGQLTATHYDKKSGEFENMRTLAPPVGKGWEYYIDGGYDYEAEASSFPELIREKLNSPSVKPGLYDLVIHPSNLWLTIHESIGHATEYDRALGYEANYAGTSFATPDKCGSLKYGSKFLNVTGDRITSNGLSTVGYDDEGVKAQSWDIIKDGVLVDYQLNRQMASERGCRSNGCAYADSFSHIPIQRMPNVSLKPGQIKCSTDDLISKVEDGIYVMGDKSWSIDMQRYNFQFTGQRFYKIKNGKLAGQINNVAYQGNTLDFWNSLSGLGDSSTYVLGGAFNCGKGQPGQIAPVSHGCPTALFNKVNILNTKQESGNA